MGRNELYEVATEAIAEAVHLLHLLAIETGRDWSNSVPRLTLDRLAVQLGYADAVEVARQVAYDVDTRRIDDAEVWM